MDLSSPVSSGAQPLPRPLVDITDFEAVNEVVSGNREIFEVIVRRYNSQLYRVGMAYLRNHAQTEDAMQNAYLKAFINLKRFQGHAAFSTWLTRIMINECLMMIRSQRRFTLADGDPDRPVYEYEFQATPAIDTVSDQEMKTLLEKSINMLPRTHRAVYMLREIQQLSTAETAACLGMSKANVKVSLHRARDGLKAQLLKSSAGVELFDYSAPFCDPMTERVMSAIRAVS